MQNLELKPDLKRLSLQQDRSYILMWIAILEYNLSLAERTERAFPDLVSAKFKQQIQWFLASLRAMESKFISTILENASTYLIAKPRINHSRPVS